MLEKKARGKGGVARCFTMRVDQILKNHSGIGVKTLILNIPDSCKIGICRLNHWLQIAIAPGIEEVTILLPENSKYSFPCSLLFGGCGNSIRYLRLSDCAFHPPVGFDCLRSLTKLHLYEVCITGDELGNLFSNSFALEQLELISCSELISLKIPFWLEGLSFLCVCDCNMLQVIESKAPNLRTFKFFGNPRHLTLGESSQVKSLDFRLSNNSSMTYAITKLPSTVPTLETLRVTSFNERVNTPMAADKFLNLKCLQIYLASNGAFPPSYDYLSLVSFLDASPSLETFTLNVNQVDVKHDSVFEDASYMRQILGHKHDRLRKVHINGFCSAKSMVELTCHILEHATSLESLTVNTIYDGFMGDDVRRCFLQKKSDCRSIPRCMILEARKALRAVSSFIVGRVSPAIKLNVWEPCSRCHAL